MIPQPVASFESAAGPPALPDNNRLLTNSGSNFARPAGLLNNPSTMKVRLSIAPALKLADPIVPSNSIVGFAIKFSSATVHRSVSVTTFPGVNFTVSGISNQNSCAPLSVARARRDTSHLHSSLPVPHSELRVTSIHRPHTLPRHYLLKNSLRWHSLRRHIQRRQQRHAVISSPRAQVIVVHIPRHVVPLACRLQIFHPRKILPVHNRHRVRGWHRDPRHARRCRLVPLVNIEQRIPDSHHQLQP